MDKKNEVWTIGSILKWTGQYFQSKGVESPRLDAEVLLSHVLGKERIYLYVHFDEPLQPNELRAFREMVKKRIARVPVAYILGHKEFMGLTFSVSPAVLVPRPDTEILVEAALTRLKERPAPVIADIGTGSGAIVLSLLKYLPLAEGHAVDIAEDALAVARQNAVDLDVADRAAFYLGNLVEPVLGRQFDAIVSNPPYIPNGDIDGLAPEVKCEPYGALAGGKDGLDFYRKLMRDGVALVKTGGFMAFEVGIDQAAAVADLAAASDELGGIEILKDYGGVERVVILHKRERVRG